MSNEKTAQYVLSQLQKRLENHLGGSALNETQLEAFRSITQQDDFASLVTGSADPKAPHVSFGGYSNKKPGNDPLLSRLANAVNEASDEINAGKASPNINDAWQWVYYLGKQAPEQPKQQPTIK